MLTISHRFLSTTGITYQQFADKVGHLGTGLWELGMGRRGEAEASMLTIYGQTRCVGPAALSNLRLRSNPTGRLFGLTSLLLALPCSMNWQVTAQGSFFLSVCRSVLSGATDKRVPSICLSPLHHSLRIRLHPYLDLLRHPRSRWLATRSPGDRVTRHVYQRRPPPHPAQGPQGVPQAQPHHL